MDDKGFLSYYARLSKEFGVQLARTAKAELGSTVLVALCTYAISHGQDTSAWTSLKYTLESCGYVLGGWGAFHLIRTPWKLSQKILNSIPVVPLLPVISLEQEVLSISVEISDFLYGRAADVPISPTAPNYEFERFSVPYNDAEGFIRVIDMAQQREEDFRIRDSNATILREYKAQLSVYSDYDAKTLEMFKYRFSRKIAAILEKLKDSGLSNALLEQFVDGSYVFMLPCTYDLKTMGETLGIMADTLKKSATTKQNLLT
jgi:hypothetical protein